MLLLLLLLETLASPITTQTLPTCWLSLPLGKATFLDEIGLKLEPNLNSNLDLKLTRSLVEAQTWGLENVLSLTIELPGKGETSVCSSLDCCWQRNVSCS